MVSMNEAVAKAIEPVADLLHKLLGPSFDEFGLALGDVARHYRIKNAVSWLGKTRKILADAGINPHTVSPKVFLPMLEGASLEDAEELQDRWAALLANAASSESNSVMPSFPHILSELTPDEVKFLDAAYDEILEDEETEIARIHKEMPGLTTEPHPEMEIRLERWKELPLILLGNLERVGLVSRNSDFGPTDHYDEQTVNVFGTINHFYLSPFGRAFVRACRAPIPRPPF